MEGAGYAEAGRFLQYVAAAWLIGFTVVGAFGDASFRQALPVRRLLVIGISVLLVGSGVSIAAQTVMMIGASFSELRWSDISLVLFETQWGWGAGARLGLAIAMLTHLIWVKPDRAAFGTSLAILATFAFTGHGMATQGVLGLLHVFADILHLFAAGTWIGMLFVFLALTLVGRAQTWMALHRWLVAFSGVGSLLVSVLIVTGIINSVFLLGQRSPSVLLNSPWVAGLIIKMGLFLVMLACAAANRFHLTPRLGQVSGGWETAVVISKLRISLWIELGVGFGVLLIIAIIGMQAPPAAA